MGTLFRKYCSVCDNEPRPQVTFDGFAGAALLASRSGGEIVAAGYLAYLSHDNILIPLPHPIESVALQSAGATWAGAALQGRLVRIHNLVCLDCGKPTTTASLTTAGTGCFSGLGLATVTEVCYVWLFPVNPLVTAMLASLALFVPPILVEEFVKFRYRDRIAQLQKSRCDHCRSLRLKTLFAARTVLLPCPRCSQQTLTIEFAGKS